MHPFSFAGGQLKSLFNAAGKRKYPGILPRRATKRLRRSDSVPIHADAVHCLVRWKWRLDRLRGIPVRLEFRMQQARRFAFDLK